MMCAHEPAYVGHFLLDRLRKAQPIAELDPSARGSAVHHDLGGALGHCCRYGQGSVVLLCDRVYVVAEANCDSACDGRPRRPPPRGITGAYYAHCSTYRDAPAALPCVRSCLLRCWRLLRCCVHGCAARTSCTGKCMRRRTRTCIRVQYPVADEHDEIIACVAALQLRCTNCN
eukprot:SAG25_NODE_2773_length_1391_cov_1.316563_3_plen_173_part_00